MANLWNPHEPDVLGPEWFPVVPKPYSPAADGPVAQRLRSRSAETVEKLRWGIQGTTTRDRSMMVVDVYEAGDETLDPPDGDVSQVEYSPTADTNVGGWFRRVDGLTTNLFEKIDENPVTYPPTQTDFGIYTTTGTPDQYRCQVGSGAFPLTSRVLRLSMRYVIASAGYEWRQSTARIYWAGAGGPTPYAIPGGNVLTHAYGKLIELDLGEINPQTLAPWTPADVRAFSTASGWELRIEGVGNVKAPVHLISLSLRVYYQVTENRVAAAVWRRPALDLSQPRAVDSDRLVTLPGGTANWAKGNALDYTFVHRIARDTLVQGTQPRANDVRIDALVDPGPSIRTPRLAVEKSYADNPVPGMESAQIVLDQWNRIKAYNARADPEVGFSPTLQLNLMMVKAAGVVSDDSQPYTTGNVNISFHNWVHTSLAEYQVMTPPSSQSYLGVEFMVVPPISVESTLTVQITTTAGVNVGGSFSITRANVMKLPDLYQRARRVAGWLSSAAALTGGTAYRVRFTSNAPAGDPWNIGTIGWANSIYTARGTTPPNGDVATFQGAASRATYRGTEDPGIDLMATLIKQPTLPSAPTAVVTDVANDTPGVFCDLYCQPAEIEVVDFSWTASAYTGGIVRWEIEREEADLPGVWVRIRHVTVEATKTIRDWAARRRIAVRYRVRAILNNGSSTDWSTSNQVTPMPKGAEVIFTSDALPSLTVAYDRDPRVTYSFLSADEDTFVTVAGQDYQKVFASPRERGRRFPYDVSVNLGNEPDVDRKGPDAFLPLHRLARSTDIPYVIVLDHEGHRFFVHLQMPEGVNEQPEHVYETTLTLTEVADTPVVITEP